jgi:hypothetical protein
MVVPTTVVALTAPAMKYPNLGNQVAVDRPEPEAF